MCPGLPESQIVQCLKARLQHLLYGDGARHSLYWIE